MNIVSRIRFPNTTDVSSLYVKLYDGASINYQANYKQVNLIRGGIVSFNSYFNAFYEKYYGKYTELCTLYYLLKLEGDFQVSIYREFPEIKPRELIYIENFEKCQLSDNVKILLPNLARNEETGRVYLEIMCLSEFGLFTEGVLVTDQDKNMEVSIGIISCTFKKEKYILKTVNTILKDSYLKDKKFKIFVVDNGSTLNENEFKDPRVQIIFNKNVGGSGGFTRGLIEALQEEKYTHFLLMDDDIELDSESIYRLFSLYEYANDDFAVAGSKLDLDKKHILNEVGGLYGKLPDRSADHPFSVALLKENLDLQDATSLNFLLVEENLDYGGFWFFSFSKEVVAKIGLPMPFFIQRDDIEFCLRIKKHFGEKIVAFPSIAVWHEPPYAKDPVWLKYYWCRNNLITHSIHKPLRYENAIKYTTKRLIFCILFFDYNSALMVVKAFEDYMKGPNFIINNAPDLLHFNILKLSQSYESKTLKPNCSLKNQSYQKSDFGIFQEIVSLLTLNGHLLPNFLIEDSDALISINSSYSLQAQWCNIMPRKRVVICREENGYLQENELNKLAGIKLLARWFKVAAKSSITWSAISADWQKASSDFTSNEFWQQYLGLKERS